MTTDERERGRAEVRAAVLEEETFLRLTLSKPLDKDATPWVRISVRPVRVRGERRLQFVYFDGKKEVSNNAADDEAGQALDEALALPFGQLHVQSTSGDLQMLVSRKGRAHLTKSRPTRHEDEPVLSHDRRKEQPLRPSGRDPFLQATRILNKSGKVRAGMRPKFNQINEFLRILDPLLPETQAAPLRLVDCGCGSALLTFAAYHYLNHTRKIEAAITGIDTNAELIAKCTTLRDSLGWEGITFGVSDIASYVPAEPPDVVLSLHACDTATDEAIAQGIRWGSRVILAAPCCQHELHRELESGPLRAVLRHGILRERLADLTTDAFRALVLRIVGYRTSVIEFVSPEATSKNLMIRAELGAKPGDPAAVAEYRELKAFWNVTPAIEGMLGDTLQALLGDS